VGAKGGDLNNITNVGKSYVVFGKANSSAINLSAIVDWPLGAPQAPTIKSSKPSPLTSPALETE
jgi:hypothetical protein